MFKMDSHKISWQHARHFRLILNLIIYPKVSRPQALFFKANSMNFLSTSVKIFLLNFLMIYYFFLKIIRWLRVKWIFYGIWPFFFQYVYVNTFLFQRSKPFLAASRSTFCRFQFSGTNTASARTTATR